MNAFRLLVLAVPCLGPTLNQHSARTPEAVVLKLKHTSAEDATKSMKAFVATNQLPVAVVAEPVSNSVFVSGEAAACKRVAEVLAALDAPAAAVAVQLTIAQVPAGFAEDVGLGPGEKWFLNPREVKLLDAAITRDRATGLCARPHLSAVESKVGFVQVGTVDVGVITRIAAGVPPNENAVKLVGDVQIGWPAARGPALHVRHTLTVAETIPTGGTLVLRGGRTKPDTEGAWEILVLLTPERVGK